MSGAGQDGTTPTHGAAAGPCGVSRVLAQAKDQDANEIARLMAELPE